ncbi:phosphatase PAP2 family protein [Patescibacteria group bacterium]|nr:phosphatase PAP2 family protein [Patescibacteria group bacterium]
MALPFVTRLAHATSLFTPIRFAPIVAAYATYIALNGDPEAGFRILISLAALGVAIAFLKVLTRRTRPNGERAHGLSLGAFPSGHSAFAWFLAPLALYTVPSEYALPVAGGAAVLAVLVGAARVHIRCHTRMQVLIGALIGILVPALVFVLA